MSKFDTKNMIIDTATELFWQRGYHNVNMNELSAEANVNKATVYQHFGSKENLAVAVVGSIRQRSQVYIYDAAFKSVEDPRQRLAEIFDRAYDMHKSLYESEGRCRGCPFVNLGLELALACESVRESVNQSMDLFTSYFRKIVNDSRVEDGVDERRQIAASLMVTMNGCLVQSKLENRPEAILEGRERAIQLLV